MMDDDARLDRPGDELDDDQAIDEDDLDEETSETRPCPECGAEIYEDSERCPACGAYVTFDSRPWSGKPAWWIVLGLVAALLAILAFTVAPRL
jgi:hypothetical protein